MISLIYEITSKFVVTSIYKLRIECFSLFALIFRALEVIYSVLHEYYSSVFVELLMRIPFTADAASLLKSRRQSSLYFYTPVKYRLLNDHKMRFRSLLCSFAFA